MQTNVTDEMIARYLSGVASPDEEAAVLDYMSENDDRLDDLLAMTAAIEQRRNISAHFGQPSRQLPV